LETPAHSDPLLETADDTDLLLETPAHSDPLLETADDTGLLLETPAHSDPLLETADDTDLLLETAGGTDEQSAVGLQCPSEFASFVMSVQPDMSMTENCGLVLNLPFLTYQVPACRLACDQITDVTGNVCVVNSTTPSLAGIGQLTVDDDAMNRSSSVICAVARDDGVSEHAVDSTSFDQKTQILQAYSEVIASVDEPAIDKVDAGSSIMLSVRLTPRGRPLTTGCQ